MNDYVEVPFLAVLLLVVAATWYITKEINEAIIGIALRKGQKRIDAIEQLHDDTMEDMAMSFDLWWAENAVSEQIRTRISDRLLEDNDDLIDAMGELGLEMATSQAISIVKGMALHVVCHSVTHEREDALMGKVPRFFGMRSDVMDQIQEHRRELEDQRDQLTSVGIDVPQMEKDLI